MKYSRTIAQSEATSEPPKWGPNRLMTSHQASSLLRSFVATSFSTRGPTGFDYQGRPLFHIQQLLTWLRNATTAELQAATQARHDFEHIEDANRESDALDVCDEDEDEEDDD